MKDIVRSQKISGDLASLNEFSNAATADERLKNPVDFLLYYSRTPETNTYEKSTSTSAFDRPTVVV